VIAEPRSGRDLTIFLIPAHLGGPGGSAIDLFATHTRSANTEYAWLLADTEVLAWQPPVADPSGALVAAYGKDEAAPGTDLTEGFAMGLDLARQFLADHQDGLPVTADILVVADSHCQIKINDMVHSRTGDCVQAGIVLHHHANASSAGLARRDIVDLGLLGWTWLHLRAGLRVRRLPQSILG
jgi:hypothetical protein